VKYIFWPPWDEKGCYSCIPDVVLEASTDSNEEIIILIEAKFHSSKSSLPDRSKIWPWDQLGKEYDNLIRKAKQSPSFLIYLTNDTATPAMEIEESKAEYRDKRKMELPVLWLSWRHLHSPTYKVANEILRDLHKSLELLSLYFFRGFSRIFAEPFSSLAKFHFSADNYSFSWGLHFPEFMEYRFQRNPQRFAWNCEAMKVPEYRWRES